MSFNKALLAKQVWRLINNPSSLAARVFRARYYRDGDIMTAKVGTSASFVWRSLAWSRALLLHKGMTWRVGDGQTIRAFKDTWIPSLAYGKLSRQIENREMIKDSDLINRDGHWDVGKIESHCWPHETTAILKLRIGGHNHADTRFWKFEENGLYSVKSGYLAEIQYYTPPDHTTAHDKKTWNSLIWALKIPPKVKIFMWRAFRGFLPVEQNLLRHHVPTNGICSQCGTQVASTEHCLLFCKKIRACWKDSRFWVLIEVHKRTSFAEIAKLLHHRLSIKEFEVWVILLWLIWHYICKLKHERENQELVNEEQAFIFWQDCHEAKNAFALGHFLGIQPGDKAWHAPVGGTFRVDVDAMFDLGGNKFGAGAIVRDSGGKIIVAMVRHIQTPETVLHAEILAVLSGIELCIQEKIQPISVFTDSLLTVRMIAGKDEVSNAILEELQRVQMAGEQGGVIDNFFIYYQLYRKCTVQL